MSWEAAAGVNDMAIDRPRNLRRMLMDVHNRKERTQCGKILGTCSQLSAAILPALFHMSLSIGFPLSTSPLTCNILTHVVSNY
jgi:hypothetical protein